MDNFLQLVPMEADADDSDSALVYGEEEDLAVHESEAAHVAPATEDSAAQFFAPLAHFVAASAGATATSATQPAPHAATSPLTSEEQRARFLWLLQKMESSMGLSQSNLDRRLATVHRIRALEGDPAQQLAEYLALLADQRHEHEAEPNEQQGKESQLAAELLECAQQMSDPRDAEVALLAAFVFLSEAPGPSSQRRLPDASAPVVAALLDESHALLSDHHHDQHSF